MKKFFTLTLAAAFAIGTAVAAIPTNKAELSFMKRDMNKGEIAAAFPTLKADKRTQEIMSKGLSMSQFSRSSEDIIWNVDAEDVTYSLQTEGFYISGLFAFYGYNSGRGMIAEDGDQVYFKNPMMSQPTGAYVVGERSGNKITAKFPQHIDDYDYNGSTISFYVGKMKQVVDDEGYISYYPVADEENELTWEVEEDGAIVLDLDTATVDEDGNATYPEYIYGMWYYFPGDEDLTWATTGDCQQRYEVFDGELVEAPADAVWQNDWAMVTAEGDSRYIDIAITDDTVYLKNLDDWCPDAVVAGQIKGDQVIFKSGQYMGYLNDYNVFLYFVATDFDWNIVDEFVFDYDAEAKSLTAAEPSYFFINAALDRIYYLSYFNTPTIAWVNPELLNAAPKAPVCYGVTDFSSYGYGFNYQWEIPAVNVNDAPLNTDNMYYEVYLNGQLHTFYPDQYIALSEPMTQIPYNFTDNYDIEVSGATHGLWLQPYGVTTCSIISYYVGDNGKVYASEPGVYSTEEPVNPEPDPEVQETWATFAYGDADINQCYPKGTGLAERYDVALYIPASLCGLTVEAVQIPLAPSADISDLTVWATTELGLKTIAGKAYNQTDVEFSIAYPEEGDAQFVTAYFPVNFKVGSEGLYVGYSFTVEEVIDRYDITAMPILVVPSTQAGGWYFHGERSYMSWVDLQAQYSCALDMQVLLSGDIADNAITLGAVPFDYYETGKENTLTIEAANIGRNEVSSIEYLVNVAGNVLETTLELDEPLAAILGKAGSIDFTLPVVEKAGSYDVTIAVNAINGEPLVNPIVTEGNLAFISEKPKHLALVEEYTGTWCGFCPRGFVAMEEAAKQNPEFVGIAYHDGDPMEMWEGYPNMVSGFPSAYLNRVTEIDPYYADPNVDGYSLPQVYEAACEAFTPVAINVEAGIEGTTVSVTSTINWAADPGEDADNFRIEYVLIADDLSGEESGWNQTNYYKDGSYGYPEYMDEFTMAGSPVRGLHFNDVAILTSGLFGVEGSVSDIKVGVDDVYNYEFDTEYAYNADGEEILFNPEKLRVIAFVLRTNDLYGTVYNAAKCNVADNRITSVSDAMANDIESVVYYDLQGRMVKNPANGLFIRSTRYTDGTVRNAKVAVK